MLGTQTLSLVHIKADGTRIDHGIVSRKKVTQAFVKRIAAQMAVSFSGADPFKWHAAGTGGTAESNADTAMSVDSGVARFAGTQVDSSTGTTGNYTSVGTLAFVSSLTIVEHGLFSLVTGGTLLDRSVFGGIAVVSGDSVQFTYQLTLNPEA
jgi:hypothetical protein